MRCRSWFARDAAPGKRPARSTPTNTGRPSATSSTDASGDAVLLGEVNLAYKERKTFFGGPAGNGLNMQFDFRDAEHLPVTGPAGRPTARQGATPATKLNPPASGPTFVRNHDELTLDKLSDTERQEVFAAFGPDPNMQLYGRDLCCRLPAMLGGDQRRIRMAYRWLFSLPGTPVLFYGEEIGMAENLSVPGRFAVRTPMQWTAAPTAASPRRPSGDSPAPQPEGLYGPDRVNVADQRRDHNSFLVVHAQPHLHLSATARDRLVDSRGAQTAQHSRCWPTYVGRRRAGR